MNADPFKALEDRVTAIERQNRWLKRICAAVGCLLAIGVFAGANIIQDSLDIHEQLIIRDRNNKVRFDIGVDKNKGLGSGIIMVDADGQRRIGLGLNDQGQASLEFYDRYGKSIRQFP